MKWAYGRCSTNESKQDISRQTRELEAMGVPKKNIVLEYESGKNVNRAGLNNLLNNLALGDTVYATEVSRVSRSTKHLCELLEVAKEKKICFVFGSFIVDCTKELDPMTEGMFKMIAVFSELESSITSFRVKSGMANAASKGKIIGRPKRTAENIPDVFYKNYTLYSDGLINKVEFARLCGVSYPTIFNYIKTATTKKFEEE